MKQPLNHLTESPAWSVHGRSGLPARWTAVALVLSAGALACSEGSPPSTSVPNGGSGGQVTTGGASGSGVVAGSAGVTTGGMPPATGGAGAGGVPVGGANGGGGASGGGGAAGSAGAGGSGGDEGWIPLFNGTNLDGWTVYGTNETLFTVANGEIHTYPTQADQSEQPQANMVHDTVLGGKYTLHVEYKWGEARFSARKQTERDAGILFHIQGQNLAPWPHSIECQIGSSPVGADWVTGDLWVIGTPMVANVKNQAGQNVEVGRNTEYASFSATAQAELPHGQWNIVDVIIDGAAEATYMVNGVEVNHVYDMSYNDQPLTEGLISIQAEYAEIFYRNIRYKVNQ